MSKRRRRIAETWPIIAAPTVTEDVETHSDRLGRSRLERRSPGPLPVAGHRLENSPASIGLVHVRQLPNIREHEPVSAMERRESPVASLIERDRKSTRLNSSHVAISYAVFCLK